MGDQTEREEGRDYMRYENMKTTLTTQTSKSRATSKISNPTTESFDAVHSKSRDGELTNETGVSVNLLHQEDLDRDNEITTEGVLEERHFNGKSVESKIPIKGIHDDGPIVSRIDNVSNDTLLQNRINERHRTNSEPKNSPHRSTISPSNNVIDDDYVEKDISRESGDLNSSSNLLRRNSDGKKDTVG